jgi:splicing factor 3B subunit 2
MDQGSDEEIVELSGMETPSGTESVIPQGMETPQIIQYLALTRNEPKSLYKVLPQQQTSISGFMGSSHAYTVESKDVALDPEELEHLDQETLKRKYEETTKVTRKRHEDVSDLVDEHAKMQAQKRVKKDTKKHKDFKF